MSDQEHPCSCKGSCEPDSKTKVSGLNRRDFIQQAALLAGDQREELLPDAAAGGVLARAQTDGGDDGFAVGRHG